MKIQEMVKVYEIDYAGRPFRIEVGKMARQANGSCTVRYGDTVVLATACRAPRPTAGLDFVPLTVNYMEMTYAAGKIPGGFFKREGRPSEREVLCSRLIDRPLRPLFKEGYNYETQIVATVLSVDQENDPEIAATIGASVALGISDIPFDGPIASVRIGMIDGSLVCNPGLSRQRQSSIDLLVAGGGAGIIMVEGGAKGASEDTMISALTFAQENLKGVMELQKKIIEECGEKKLAVEVIKTDPALVETVKGMCAGKLKEALSITTKIERYGRIGEIKEELLLALAPDSEEKEKEILSILEDLRYAFMRKGILEEGMRVDGRGPKDIREISCEVGLLPRTHGSALFTRGETQAMVVTTLGTSEDEQKIDALSGWEYKTFMLHYNFPPFSVGEVKFLRGPGRREIGHGALAERGVSKILPEGDVAFPYTIRVVSDILESNGSSSMATVCGASLALVDAGVPIKAPVAGIAMGLVIEGDQYAILTDIAGAEDHYGDMDFKVSGTHRGITALQMDLKVGGITSKIMAEALE